MKIGKITQHRAGYYYIPENKNLICCRARGLMRHKEERPLVGDMVEYTMNKDGSGNIEKILKRKNRIIRPRIANVDQAIIVTSCKQPRLSTLLLDKFISYFEYNDVDVVLVFTKIDLLKTGDIEKKWIEEYKHDGFKVYEINSLEELGTDNIKHVFSGKISVLAGQTGAGKTTLLNAMIPSENRKTQEISLSLGRGKHTTRETELIPYLDGMIADTPGFSSLKMDELNMDKQDIAISLKMFEEKSLQCKFRGCLHMSEPHCKIKEDVNKGVISATRYENYLKILNEV